MLRFAIRPTRLSVCFGLAVLAAPGVASAQIAPPPSAPPPVFEATDAGSPTSGATASPPAFALPPPTAAPPSGAADLYRRGYDAMVRQDWQQAEAVFDDLVARYPDSPEASPSLEMSRLARDSEAAARLKLREPQLGESKIDRSGRTELLITAAVMGLWSGAALGIVADWGAEGTFVTSGVAGLGALGLGLLAVSHASISEGGASLISTGLLFGTLDGVFIDFDLSSPSTELATGIAWLGSLAGMGIAIVVQAYVPISPGQASLIAGGGFLAGTLEGLAFVGDSGGNPGQQAVATGLIFSTTIGLIGGAVASHWFHPTRARVVLSELAGLIGGVIVGGGVALAESAPNQSASLDPVPISIGAAIAMLAGAGVVLAVTQDMNESVDAEVARLTPPGVQLTPPSVLVAPSMTGARQPIVGLQLLAGQF